MAAAVMDQAGVLQMSGGYGYAFTAPTEHVGDELLGHEQFRTILAVVAQQQPTAKPLLHRMQAVTNSGL